MTKAYGTPGPRAIYPDLCDSRTLARCGLMANALFPRLIIQSDDQGRIHGDATDIASLCFPKMPRVWRDVPKAMDELDAVGAVIRYLVDDEPYVQVASWWEYQGHMRRAYPSRHPAPPGWEDRVYGRWKDDKGEDEDPRGESGQAAAERGDLPRQSESLPQSAATRAGAYAGAVPSGPIPVSPIPSGPVRPPAAARPDGSKNRSDDEELLARYLAQWSSATDPDRRDMLATQLRLMGVKDPAAELARGAA